MKDFLSKKRKIISSLLFFAGIPMLILVPFAKYMIVKIILLLYILALLINSIVIIYHIINHFAKNKKASLDVP